MTDWFQNDELFFEQLETGHVWAEYVAHRLIANGLQVTVTPLKRRETIEDRHAFRGEIDLVVNGNPVEVKSRNLSFSEDPTSYPYRTAFVDTVSGWMCKNPMPVAVVLVSQQTRAMLVVAPNTQPDWDEIHAIDRVRNIEDIWFAVDRNQLLPFQSLIEAFND